MPETTEEETATPFEAALAAANKALEQRDYELALTSFRTLQQQFPQAAAGAFGVALTLITQGDAPGAVTAASEGISAYPSHIGLQIILADALVMQGDEAAARSVLTTASAQHPTNPQPPMALAKLAQTTDHWRHVEIAARTVLETHTAHGALHSLAAQAMREQGDKSGARKYLTTVVETHPTLAACHRSLGWLAAESERWDEALRHWSAAGNDEPVAIAGTADALAKLRRFDEARSGYQQLRERFPDEPRGWTGEAALEHALSNHRVSVDLWAQAHRRFPKHLTTLDGYFYALLDASQFEPALDLLEPAIWKSLPIDAQEARRQRQLMQADYHVIRYEFDEAVATLEETLRDAKEQGHLSERLRVSCLAKLGHVAMRAQDRPDFVATMIARIEEVEERPLYLQVSLVRLYIAAGDFNSAATATSAIPEFFEQTQLALEMRSWLAAHDKRTDEAHTLFDELLANRYQPQIHCEIRNLENVGGASIEPSDVVVFVAARNESLRLPDFFRHHRELGVDKFVVIDNLSDDSTPELLRAQDDVVHYVASDDYVTAGLGMRWVNHLIEKLPHDQWCVFLDADELLVYPDYEHRPIQHLTDYLDRNGHDTVLSFMLDMHPESLNSATDYVQGDRLLAANPYFTNTYDFQPMSRSPYETVKGGFRDTVLGIRFREQTKCPLVRSKSGIKFLSSSHETTPSRISDVSTALLHFKFVGDSAARAKQETEWTTYSYYANRQRQHEQLAEKARRDGDVPFLTSDAVRYEGSGQLVDLGLLRKPAGY